VGVCVCVYVCGCSCRCGRTGLCLPPLDRAEQITGLETLGKNGWEEEAGGGPGRLSNGISSC